MIKLSACASHTETPPVSTPGEAKRLVARMTREGLPDAFYADLLATAHKRILCCPAGAYTQELVQATFRAGDLYG